VAELKCEYPEGCMLDLWAQVIKAKYCEKQVKVLDTVFCVPDERVGGKIRAVEDIKVKVIKACEDLSCYNKVKIHVEFEVILFVIVGTEYQIITVGDSYNQVIELDEFDPPLTVEEFREEVDESEVCLRNWSFDYEILGNSEDPSNPANLSQPLTGTAIALRVYVDIIDKLGKMHNVIVYGEIEPDDYICK
jgi:hypothetical protein